MGRWGRQEPKHTSTTSRQIPHRLCPHQRQHPGVELVMHCITYAQTHRQTSTRVHTHTHTHQQTPHRLCPHQRRHPVVLLVMHRITHAQTQHKRNCENSHHEITAEAHRKKRTSSSSILSSLPSAPWSKRTTPAASLSPSPFPWCAHKDRTSESVVRMQNRHRRL